MSETQEFVSDNVFKEIDDDEIPDISAEKGDKTKKVEKAKRRSSYPIGYKQEVLKLLESNSGNIYATAKQCGVQRSLLYGWLKQKDDIMKLVTDSEQNIRKRRKVVQDDEVIANRGKYPELEEKLYEWFKNTAIRENIHLSMQNWQQKALEIFKEIYPNADEQAFKASNGWLIRFLRRHRITTITSREPSFELIMTIN